MTFVEFKDRLIFLLRNDGITQSDERIKAVIKKCANEILGKYTILDHVEIDKRGFKPLRYLDSYYFLRGYENKEDIDFEDENIITALLYAVASELSLEVQRQVSYRMHYLKHISSYGLATFKDDIDTLQKALKFWGYEKPYIISLAINPYYRWESAFLDSLDDFMSDRAYFRDMGYTKFIELFVKYQDNLIDRADLRDLDLVMSSRVRKK